jgi:hypothetical protein
MTTQKYNKRGWAVGTPFWEWAQQKGMTENEITTARVFLVLGLVLGIIIGTLLTVSVVFIF